jgi:hypothetical protein
MYPDETYEFLNELSFMVKNTNRSIGSGYDMFRWKNVLDNKIKNLMFQFIHILTIPLFPFMEKNKTLDIDNQIFNYLILNKNTLSLNQVLNFVINNINTTIHISYIDIDFIDFSTNYDYEKTYSIEFKTQSVYLYTRSKRRITDESCLYIDIDSNDTLDNNVQLNTSLNLKKFSFKVVPITITSNYVYYKALGQFLLRTLNELINAYNIMSLCVICKNNFIDNDIEVQNGGEYGYNNSNQLHNYINIIKIIKFIWRRTIIVFSTYIEEKFYNNKSYFIYKTTITADEKNILANIKVGTCITKDILSSALASGSLFIRKCVEGSEIQDFSNILQYNISEYIPNLSDDYNKTLTTKIDFGEFIYCPKSIFAKK